MRAVPPPRDSGRTNGGSGVLRWHRRVGVTLAIVLLIVALTGVALNHGEQFNLREIRIDAAWLHRWYGMQPRGEPVAFADGERSAVWLDGSLYLDALPVARVSAVRGVVALDAMLVVAAPRELVLLTSEGEVVERLGDASLPPAEIVRVGRTAGDDPRVVVETTVGRSYVFDSEFVRWAELGAWRPVTWSVAAAPPPALRERVIAAYRGEGLTLHRVIVDLHSGRIFGRVGIWVVDAAAIGLLFLTFSGVYSVIRGRRKAS